MRTIHAMMMRETVSAMRSASKRFGTEIDTSPSHIGTAFSANAMIANAQIKGTRDLTNADLKQGVDLMFLYLSTPRGAKEKTSRKKIPSGFYIVRVWVDKRLRGRAVLLNQSRSEIVALPVSVEREKVHSVSGSFSRCHVTADVGIIVFRRPIVITVTVQWC